MQQTNNGIRSLKRKRRRVSSLARALRFVSKSRAICRPTTGAELAPLLPVVRRSARQVLAQPLCDTAESIPAADAPLNSNVESLPLRPRTKRQEKDKVTREESQQCELSKNAPLAKDIGTALVPRTLRFSSPVWWRIGKRLPRQERLRLMLVSRSLARVFSARVLCSTSLWLGRSKRQIYPPLEYRFLASNFARQLSFLVSLSVEFMRHHTRPAFARVGALLASGESLRRVALSFHFSLDSFAVFDLLYAAADNRHATLKRLELVSHSNCLYGRSRAKVSLAKLCAAGGLKNVSRLLIRGTGKTRSFSFPLSRVFPNLEFVSLGKLTLSRPVSNFLGGFEKPLLFCTLEKCESELTDLMGQLVKRRKEEPEVTTAPSSCSNLVSEPVLSQADTVANDHVKNFRDALELVFSSTTQFSREIGFPRNQDRFDDFHGAPRSLVINDSLRLFPSDDPEESPWLAWVRFCSALYTMNGLVVMTFTPSLMITASVQDELENKHGLKMWSVFVSSLPRTVRVFIIYTQDMKFGVFDIFRLLLLHPQLQRLLIVGNLAGFERASRFAWLPPMQILLTEEGIKNCRDAFQNGWGQWPEFPILENSKDSVNDVLNFLINSDRV